MALKEMAVPESPKLYTKKYQGLLGVDYSCDITEIDPRRTPTGLNMISDEGANPVKRLGWRVIKQPHAIIGGRSMASIGKVLRMVTRKGEDAAHGEYEMPDLWVVSTLGIFYLHHPSDQHYSTGYTSTQKYGIQSYDDESQLIKNCVLYTFNGSLYCIMTTAGGKNLGLYKLWDGDLDVEVFQRIDGENAYIPETTYGLKPNGIGGTSYYDVNLLSPKMTFSFCSDGSKNFYLYPEAVRNNLDKRYILSDIRVQVLTNGVWTDVPASHYTKSGVDTASGWNFDGTAVETFNIMSPHITFNDGYVPESHTTQGSDNVKITFAPFDANILEGKTYEGQTAMKGLYREAKDDLLATNTFGIFGHTKPDRVFLAGGKKKNRVYYSYVNNPTYFPDTNYIEVGHDDNDIIALQRMSDYLAVIKGSAVFDNTMYMVKGSYLDDSMYFMVVPTSTTVGGIAPQASANLIGEPLFLSNTGIYAVTSIYGSNEQTVRSRSRFVDRKLTKEPNLENAIATVWNRYYVLCVNNHCYVLDSRNVNRQYRYDTSYQYEAYYWEGVPACAFAVYENELFFGTEDGKICKFNTDVPDNTKYCDNGREVWVEIEGQYYFSLSDKDEFGEPQASVIPCEWSTPLDDDGSPQYYKTLNKKGNVVTMLPQTKTSVEVTLVKDGIQYKSLDTYYANIFDWGNINFAVFPFTSNITARDDFVRKKVKKYKRLQIILKNEGMFEPFGILGIVKTYYFGNFAK